MPPRVVRHLRSATCRSSPVATWQVYVISRHDLARISSLNPEFQPLLEELTARYPTDEQLLATWKHDRAWGQYKSKLAAHALDVSRGDVVSGHVEGRICDVRVFFLSVL